MRYYTLFLLFIMSNNLCPHIHLYEYISPCLDFRLNSLSFNAKQLVLKINCYLYSLSLDCHYPRPPVQTRTHTPAILSSLQGWVGVYICNLLPALVPL